MPEIQKKLKDADYWITVCQKKIADYYILIYPPFQVIIWKTFFDLKGGLLTLFWIS
jgi:hypothetical protein